MICAHICFHFEWVGSEWLFSLVISHANAGSGIRPASRDFIAVGRVPSRGAVSSVQSVYVRLSWCVRAFYPPGETRRLNGRRDARRYRNRFPVEAASGGLYGATA
jgi:hypothetical protein